MSDDEEWWPFAVGTLSCPRCGEAVPVPVEYRWSANSEGRLVGLETRAVVGDVWMHDWVHAGTEGDSTSC